MTWTLATVLALWIVVLVAGCTGDKPGSAGTHVSGIVSVRAEADSSTDWSGFEVGILSVREGGVDTLAWAVTDRAGVFSMDVRAPARGFYPLVFSRGGTPLALEQLVLSDGDSVTVRASFPLEGRPIRLVSRENAAWAAFRNTKSAFGRTASAVLNSADYSPAAMVQTVVQTSNILWTLRETYAGTMGASLAEAEAIVMLSGWDDSLAVARLGMLPPDHPGLEDVLRAVRRSVARLDGQSEAIAFLERYADLVPGDKRPAVLSEIVVARMDSLQSAEALVVARELVSQGGEWGTWAGRAVYEMENLMPGMTAPDFTVIDREGRAMELGQMRGTIVLLEFYRPDQNFLAELAARESLVEVARPAVVNIVSVSVEPDSLIDAALFEGRRLSGGFVRDTDGLQGELARSYNVNVLPTRVLIDPQGRIVSKYVGSSMDAVRFDLATVLRLYTMR